MRRILLSLALVTAAAAPALAQRVPSDTARAAVPARSEATPEGARLDLPIFDGPYNTSYGGRLPSMAQSLAVTADAYDAAHLGIERAFGKRRTLGRAAIAAFDVLGLALPLGDA